MTAAELRKILTGLRDEVVISIDTGDTTLELTDVVDEVVGEITLGTKAKSCKED